MHASPVLTLREVACYLNVHPNTIYRLAQRGLIPGFKMGSDWRFNRESIDRWRLAQEQASAQNISAEQATSQPLKDEILHVVYWYQAEGFSQMVTASDVHLFVDKSSRAITGELNRLMQVGWAARENAGREKRYRLTPQGLAQARLRFGRETAKTAGHASVVEFALQRQEEGQPRPSSQSEGRN